MLNHRLYQLCDFFHCNLHNKVFISLKFKSNQRVLIICEYFIKHFTDLLNLKVANIKVEIKKKYHKAL